VKIAVTTGECTRISTASAIDLAGSEDNRRTENDKERMVESASINKSLFVLAHCVEAISKKHTRIPYRESKMTRILSLGQNNGLTLMILNLAPVRAYHLDTISSLNFANRTKKIEVREVENEPMFKGPTRPAPRISASGPMQRQPLKPLTSSVNVNITVTDPTKADEKKPMKAFFVYSDKQTSKPQAASRRSVTSRRSSPLKRNSDAMNTILRPTKPTKNTDSEKPHVKQSDISAEKINELVEKKVEEILAARALDDSAKQQVQVSEINEQVQRRLELLERRIEGTEDARAEGLSYLLMAKQHHGRGEDASALRMYKLALPFFPRNEKLVTKISTLEEKLQPRPQPGAINAPLSVIGRGSILSIKKQPKPTGTKRKADLSNDEYRGSEQEDANDDDEGFGGGLLSRKRTASKFQKTSSFTGSEIEIADFDCNPDDQMHSPRTAHLLSVINSRDISQIRLLKGVGAKKAEAIVDCLCEMDIQGDSASSNDNIVDQARVRSLAELGRLKGVGLKTVQNMRSGVMV
jgi:hypothetical protein